MTSYIPNDVQKEQASFWFARVRDDLCAVLEGLEDNYAGPDQSMNAGRFRRHKWRREGGGGGEMGVLEGRVFEKAGVNVSTVHGEFAQAFRKDIPGATEDPRFWASGISVVIHPRSPLVPIVHMNTRMIVTSKAWFGGGADLTPCVPYVEDTHDFHEHFKTICDAFDGSYYPQYKKWADDYFYLPHRNEARGVGGLFYDYHNTGNWDADFAFTKAVGSGLAPIYRDIVARRMNQPWTDADKQAQLKKRGRYVEFNLLYDRGTAFGLKTGGFIEAILMSLPPVAAWPAPDFDVLFQDTLEDSA